MLRGHNRSAPNKRVFEERLAVAEQRKKLFGASLTAEREESLTAAAGHDDCVTVHCTGTGTVEDGFRRTPCAARSSAI